MTADELRSLALTWMHVSSTDSLHQRMAERHYSSEEMSVFASLEQSAQLAEWNVHQRERNDLLKETRELQETSAEDYRTHQRAWIDALAHVMTAGEAKVIEAAKLFVDTEQAQSAYAEVEDSDSASIPAEYMLLVQAVRELKETE